MTVQAIEWALERRSRFPDFTEAARVFVNENGVPLDRPTKNGNANQIIPNHFARLIKRIQDDGQEIRSLSFNKLRKTATQLVRSHSDGEVAGVFACHGQPVNSDDLSDAYSNRPFGKVFEAIRKVQAYLAPVFEEAGPTPFAPQAQAYTKRSDIERILKLYDEGYPTGQIAAAVRMHGSAVSRLIRANRPLRDKAGESSQLSGAKCSAGTASENIE